ncbi:MAG: hypothetical protein ACYC6G_14005 [Desulfobaccales bacterium]
MKDNIIKHWFPNHTREIEWKAPAPVGQGEIEFLRWGQPGTCVNRINYLRCSNQLFVCGDLGEAIYGGWDKGYPLEWIAGLDLSYFAGKCQASETGREYFEWSEEEARKRLTDYFNNWDNPAAQAAKARDMGAFSSLYSEGEWHEFMSHYGPDLLGDDYWEMGNVGRKVNIRCQGHLIGLKMAFGKPLKYVGE